MGWARYAHSMRIFVFNSGLFYLRCAAGWAGLVCGFGWLGGSVKAPEGCWAAGRAGSGWPVSSGWGTAAC